MNLSVVIFFMANLYILQNNLWRVDFSRTCTHFFFCYHVWSFFGDILVASWSWFESQGQLWFVLMRLAVMVWRVLIG